MQNHLCIHKITGNDLNIDSNDPNFMDLCLNQNGKIIDKNDRLDPDSDWLCYVNNRPIFSKRDCNKKRGKYREKIDIPPLIPIKKNVKPNNNSIYILSSLYLIIVISFIMYLFSMFKKYWPLKYFMGTIFLLNLNLYLFCPLNICTLSGNTILLRRNPTLFTHNIFCKIFPFFTGCEKNYYDITKKLLNDIN